MSAPKRNTPKSRSRFPDRSEVSKRISDYGATGDLDRLVENKCESHTLLELLAYVGGAEAIPSPWRKYLVFKSRQLRSIARRMRQCANEIEVLDSGSMLGLMAWPKFSNGQIFDGAGESPDFSRMGRFLHSVAQTPVLLRGFADVMDETSKNPRLKPRFLSSFNLALACVVAYVQRCTRSPHDREVSALVNAVCQKDGYTADTLKAWRSEHREDICNAAEALPFYGR
ncbi:MAG: hypothetical protein WB556_20505 [Candidatus Acidiferrum sp.]